MGRGLDFYEVLGLTRNADDTEIRRAYRRLALKYHPDVNKESQARTEFTRICEAYDVLSEPKRKGYYDLYGEDSLKDGLPDGKGGQKGGFYSFDPDTTPLEVFERFFGTKNPYEALDALSSHFEALTTAEKPQQGKNKLYTVELTLEEIYHGCLKKVSHKRKVMVNDGEFIEETRNLVIDVKPGLPAGTRFVFEGEGNKTAKKEAGPVVFVLKAAPHPRFSRRGADLVHKVTLPLYKAVTGGSIEVQMLDNRTLAVPISDIIAPGTSITVPGEGMPKPGGGGRGNLILEINLLFPASLTEPQKMLLKAAFFLPAQLSLEQAKAMREFEAAFKHEKHGWATSFPKEEKQ